MDIEKIISDEKHPAAFFARASSRVYDEFYTTVMDGAKKFKRESLGLCGKSTIKTLDETAALLLKLQVAKSLEEGKEITRSLAGRGIVYSRRESSYGFIVTKSIRFAERGNAFEGKKYEIHVESDWKK